MRSATASASAVGFEATPPLAERRPYIAITATSADHTDTACVSFGLPSTIDRTVDDGVPPPRQAHHGRNEGWTSGS